MEVAWHPVHLVLSVIQRPTSVKTAVPVAQLALCSPPTVQAAPILRLSFNPVPAASATRHLPSPIVCNAPAVLFVPFATCWLFWIRLLINVILIVLLLHTAQSASLRLGSPVPAAHRDIKFQLGSVWRSVGMESLLGLSSVTTAMLWIVMAARLTAKLRHTLPAAELHQSAPWLRLFSLLWLYWKIPQPTNSLWNSNYHRLSRFTRP
jgi:hypothetical protein